MSAVAFWLLLPLTALTAAWSLTRGVSLGSRPTLALALAPLLLFGVSSIAFFSLSYLGLASGSAPCVAAMAISILLAICSVRRSRVAQQDASPPSGHRRAEIALVVAVALSAALAFLIVRVWNEARPYGDYDAIAMWNTKSRFAFHAEEPITSVLARLDVALHPDYPLLVSLAVATGFRALGAAPVWVPQVHGVFVLGGLALTLFLAARTAAGRPCALALVALLLSTPLVLESTGSQMADLPLAYLVLLSALLLDRPQEPRLMALGGFALGCAVWTKNEGALFAGALAMVTVARAWWGGSLRRSRRGLCAAAWGGAAPTLTWLLFTLAVGRENDLRGEVMLGLGERIGDLERWWHVSAALVEQLFGAAGRERFGLSWLLFFGAAAVALRRGRATDEGRAFARRFLFLGLAGLVAWIWIFVLTPKDLEWHLRTAGQRLLLQLWPLFAVGAAGEIADSWRLPLRPRRPRPENDESPVACDNLPC